MRTTFYKLVLSVCVVTLLLLPAVSLAMDIIPNYDANLSQAQKDILDAKIALWEARLCSSIVVTIDFSNADLGVSFSTKPEAPAQTELVTTYTPMGEWLTLGVTDQFQERPDGTPQSARIRFNSNAAVTWHYGGVPVPAGQFDFWTIANHEIVHAIGFTVNYTRFAAQVTPGPDDNRTYTCGATTATLTPADEGTHLDDTAHPGSLMNSTIGTGERRTPSPLEIAMLNCPWEYATAVELSTFSAVGRSWGIDVTWETATELDNAGFNLYRSTDKAGKTTMVNNEVIAAAGDELKGSSYSFRDRDVMVGVTYYYWLEDVDLFGAAARYGPVSASLQSVPGRPREFMISQIHPNPFKEVTEIRYALPADTDVNLSVYSVRGERIRVLVDEHQPAGQQVIGWDGRGENGMDVAGGIYFLRFEAGNCRETAKLIVLE